MAVKFGILINGDPQTTIALPELTRVEVRESLGEAISYTVVFAEDVCEGDFQLLKHPALMPCKEISIWVEVNDNIKVYLVKGPVKSQQIKIVNGGQGSEVQIKGSDNSIKMKQAERNLDHKNKTDDAIIKEILKNNGFESHVEIDQSLPNDESKHGKMQNQDDLTIVKQLASENGLYFFFTYDETGKELAHFHKLPLDKKPDVKLVINANDPAKNNIDELSINWDADVPVKVVGQHLDTKTKKKIDASVDSPPQTKLGGMTLQQITQDCKQEVKASPRTVDEPARSQQRSRGALDEAEWFIKASCATSYDRLCDVVHAHTVVELQGAGSRHSGKYLVSAVTHTIDVSSYKMQLELKRNAWDPLTANGLQALIF